MIINEQGALGTILVVDDELANLHLLSEILTTKGYKVRAAKTGREAVASVQSEVPHLILLDINLPDIQGYQVCEILKANEKSKDIPVIFLSAMHDTSEKLHAFSAGAVDYVTKPFVHEEVLARVQTHLAISLLHSQLENQARNLQLSNAQLKFEAEQRRQKETALQSSEKRFRELFENSSAVKLVLDPDTGNILEANRAAADFYGWPIDQLKQMRIQEVNLLPEADIRADLEKIRSIGSTRSEFRHRLSDASIREVEVFSGKIELEGKDQIYSIVHDITDRKQAEEALRDIEVSKREEEFKRQIEARYSATFSALNDGLWDWHVPSGEAVFSDVYYQMLGYNNNEFPANYVSWRRLVHPDDINRVEQILRRSLASGQGFNVDLRMKMKSDEWKWVAIRGKSIESDSENKPLRMIGTLSDISERKQAERKLTESHELLNNLACLVPGVVYQFRLYADGRSAFPYSSPGIKTIYEVSPEEVRDDAGPVFSRLHPEDRDRVAETIFESARTLETFYCEFRVILPRQGLRWRWSQAQPQRMKDGSTLWHGIISDITERKRAEETLRASEEDLRESQRIAHVGSWRLDLATNQVVWSDELYKMYGFDPKLPPPPYTEHQKLFTTESWGKLANALQKTRETGTLYELELETLRIDGSHGWMWVHGMSVLDANGSTIGLRGVAQDITERKRAEERIRESNEYLENLINYANVPIVVWDMQFRITRFNHAFEELTGKNTDEVLGKSIKILFPPDQISYSMTLIKETLEGERWKHIEISIQHIDGSIRTVLWNSATIFGPDRRTPVAIIAQGYDITDRKQAEEEKKTLQAHLQQAQKMEAIGTLAGGIAHDFNNILGAILGYAELAQEDSPAESMVRKDLDQVIKASHRAKDLVKQILAFSRQAETNQIPLQPRAIIKEAVKMLRSSLPTTIEIQQDIDPEAGLILADPTQIHQVIVNLCTNAFHAMEETGGSLSISLQKKTLTQRDLANEAQVQPGNFVKLSIGDTGPGIAPEIQKKMFDPFFTTKEVGKGTGMGLAIIHGIVKSYKGFVTCHSQPGEGTVFHVYLPTIADPALLKVETVPFELTQLGSEHILLIDDEEILADVGKAMLERLGYRVTVRRNSLEALHTFQNQPNQFDLVITDQTMPGMTGSDLARRMLQIRPGLPIILCTGYSSVMSEEKARALGIKGFAFKPLAKNDLATLIRTLLDV
jgi:PAS domain S-box-containing protein